MVDNKPYSVSLEKEEQFLKDHPNAVLQVNTESTDLVDKESIENPQGVDQPTDNQDILQEYLKLSDREFDFRQSLNLNSDNESLQKSNELLNNNLEKIKLANSQEGKVSNLDDLSYEQGQRAKASITNHPNSLLVHDSYKYDDKFLNLDPWQKKAVIKTKGELETLEKDLKQLDEEYENVLKDRIPIEERVMATFDKFDEIMLKPTSDEEAIRNRYFSKNVFFEGDINLLSQLDTDEPDFFDEDYQKSRATWQSAIQEDKEKTIIAQEEEKDYFVDLKYKKEKDRLENEIVNKKANLEKNYLNKYQL